MAKRLMVLRRGLQLRTGRDGRLHWMRAANAATPTERAKLAEVRPNQTIQWRGLRIRIENPRGTVRRGVDRDGTPWETHMRHHYGEILCGEGIDGDKLDVFLGPRADGDVYVIHQREPATGKVEEEKVMLGFGSAADAKRAFLANYDSPGYFGGMESVTFDDFCRDRLGILGEGRPGSGEGEPVEKSFRYVLLTDRVLVKAQRAAR